LNRAKTKNAFRIESLTLFYVDSGILKDCLQDRMTDQNLIPQADIVISAKRLALAERKAKTPIEAVRALASMQKRPQPVLNNVSQDGPVMLIGQVKYAPTHASIHASYDPVASALRFAQNGFDAIALFTDETLYEGGLDDLVLISRAVGLPVISQDYILDEYQVVEARAAGASALILSSAILEPATLRALLSSTQRNRMTAIVEVHTQEELDYALSLSPYVIGITSRDTWTGEIISDHVSQLRQRIPSNIRVMLTDGLQTVDDIETAVTMGMDAVLVSETMLEDVSQVKQVKLLAHRTSSTDY
jgi:indole-3-glycerol phosphate synthase